MERNDMPGGAGGMGAGAQSFGGFETSGDSGNRGESAREGLADVGSEARERASSAKDSLADALDTGADRLEKRGQRMAQESSDGIAGDGRVQHATSRVASGMHTSADWLREHDLNDLRTNIEEQVRAHPGRSLLIAVGVGYLIGKAFRR